MNEQREKVGNAKYIKIHRWLRKEYGKADHCESEECKNNSVIYEWALLDGYEYDFKRDIFIQLCRSCHTKYDYTDKQRKQVGDVHRGKIESEETKKRKSIAQKERGKDPKNHSQYGTKWSEERRKKFMKTRWGKS